MQKIKIKGVPSKFHEDILSHCTPQIRLLRQMMLKNSITWMDVL
jgi:hypothetical protein